VKPVGVELLAGEQSRAGARVLGRLRGERRIERMDRHLEPLGDDRRARPLRGILRSRRRDVEAQLE